MKKINVITFFLVIFYSYLNVALADSLASSNLDNYGIKSENEAKKDFDEHCRNEYTKRGVLNNRMYNHCYKYEAKGYSELLYTLENDPYPWLSTSLPKIIEHWTKRGVTQWSMVDFDVKNEIDAYLDVKYMREHQEVSIQKIDSCYYKSKDYEEVWGMTRFCLKN